MDRESSRTRRSNNTIVQLRTMEQQRTEDNGEHAHNRRGLTRIQVNSKLLPVNYSYYPVLNQNKLNKRLIIVL